MDKIKSNNIPNKEKETLHISYKDFKYETPIRCNLYY